MFTIPADRRLVIEHITLNAIAPSDQDILFYLSITNGTNSNYVEHTIAARREPGRTLFVASDSLKAYGAPGTQACVAVRRMNSTYTGNVIVSYSLSGYLVTP